MVNRFQLIATTFAVASLAMGTVFSVSKPAMAQQRFVTCESQNNQRKLCRMDTQGGVRLVKQLSRTSCDGNWGSTRNAVWVRNGCRAEFVSGRRRYNR
jgi:hypothetical protein